MILQVLGLFTLITLLYRLSTFLRLYFLHTSALPKYLHPGVSSYALVTGASDGIGLALTRQLLQRGFNTILHGRNPEKLQRLCTQLTQEFPDRTTLFVAADAAASETNASVAKIVQRVEESSGKLTVLINNVGGSSIFGVSPYAPLKDMPSDALNKSINLNAKFPTLLTHALLPTLVKNRPSLIVNLGSYAGVWGLPFLTAYAPSKAFNHTFSASLAKELPLVGMPNVEVLGMIVGSVLTPGNPHEQPSFSTLTADEIARSILARVGCGWRGAVVANWRQCLLGESLRLLPKRVAERMLEKEMQMRYEQEERKL